MRACAQAECEGPGPAAARAESLLVSRLTPSDRAHCLTILAGAAAYRGDIQTGLRMLDAALRLVTDDPVHTARLEYRVTGSLLSWIGIEPALARLPRFRQAVTKSGDGYATVGLHLLCGEIQIKRNNSVSAATHLATAASLLQSFPNLTNEFRLLQLRSNWGALKSNFHEALELAELCRQNAQEAGRLASATTALANIAHFSLVRGDFRRARECLDRAKECVALPDPLAICIGSTELELALADRDDARAARVAESVQHAAQALEGGHAFYALWFAASRTRWLNSSGHAADAATVAVESVPYADRLGDSNLRTYLRLFGAEAALRACDQPTAFKLLQEVIAENDLGLDHLGELSRIAGLLAASTDPVATRRQFERADRIFRSVGLVTAANELQQTRMQVADLVERPGLVSDRDSEPANLARAVSESWLTIVDVLRAPEIVGREILEILRATQLAQAATLIRTGAGSTSPITVANLNPATEPACDGSEENVVRIALSKSDSEVWELLVLPRDEASAKLGVLGIDRGISRLRVLTHTTAEGSSLSALLVDESRADVFGMIVAAENMTELVRITERVATSNVTVLFTGETGTGKELLARALHESSPRRAKAFIPFNCTTVSREMIDGQLFGYRRGAFTGAQEAFPGVIRAAAGGTLFLDEIGEMPLDVQPKLLRFLESGEIHPLGEPRPITVDVRVVAATNANLEQMVADGRFREDLFYRLNVVRLQVPPLRERREEIPLLVHHFIDRFSRESQKTGIRLAEETMEYLVLFKWPGNVRQLANEIRRLVALAESSAVLMPEHLSTEIASSRRTIPASERGVAPTEFVVRMDQPMSAAIEHLERSMIQYAIKIAAGRFEDAAQLLGLSRKGLYLKRQRLNMANTDFDEDQPSIKKLG
jgi:DNA-binding NtrC family response regulator